jgi:hypothetical protein
MAQGYGQTSLTPVVPTFKLSFAMLQSEPFTDQLLDADFIIPAVSMPDTC